MATRDPNIISEHFIPAGDMMAVVHEFAGEKGSTFEILNKTDIPGHLHGVIMDQAKRAEEKSKEKKKNGTSH